MPRRDRKWFLTPFFSLEGTSKVVCPFVHGTSEQKRLSLWQVQAFDNLARFRIHTDAPLPYDVIDDLDLVKDASARLPKFGPHGSSRSVRLRNLRRLRER